MELATPLHSNPKESLSILVPITLLSDMYQNRSAYADGKEKTEIPNTVLRCRLFKSGPVAMIDFPMLTPNVDAPKSLPQYISSSGIALLHIHLCDCMSGVCRL